MPADKRRKQLVVRLMPDDIASLDALAAFQALKLGRKVHRSEALSHLLVVMREKLPKGKALRQAVAR